MDIVRIGLLDVLRLSWTLLLLKEVFEILGAEGDNVLRVLADHCLGVVLEDVGEVVWNHDLLRTVDALLTNVCHRSYRL